MIQTNGGVTFVEHPTPCHLTLPVFACHARRERQTLYHGYRPRHLRNRSCHQATQANHGIQDGWGEAYQGREGNKQSQEIKSRGRASKIVLKVCPWLTTRFGRHGRTTSSRAWYFLTQNSHACQGKQVPKPFGVYTAACDPLHTCMCLACVSSAHDKLLFGHMGSTTHDLYRTNEVSDEMENGGAD